MIEFLALLDEPCRVIRVDRRRAPVRVIRHVNGILRGGRRLALEDPLWSRGIQVEGINFIACVVSMSAGGPEVKHAVYSVRAEAVPGVNATVIPAAWLHGRRDSGQVRARQRLPFTDGHALPPRGKVRAIDAGGRVNRSTRAA